LRGWPENPRMQGSELVAAELRAGAGCGALRPDTRDDEKAPCAIRDEALFL